MKVLVLLLLAVIYVAQVHGAATFEPVNFCKFYEAKPKCNKYDKYRTMNGFCNNLKNPKWGGELGTYQRFMGANYEDGIFEVKKARNGHPLPNARKLSLKLFTNRNKTSHEFTNMLPQFGQFFVGVIGSTADIFIPIKCCFDNGTLYPEPRDPMCMYIPIDSTDPTYAEQPRECIPFRRTQTDILSNCPGFKRNGPANQVNQATAYLDLSGMYGTSDDEMKMLRKYEDGLMKLNIVNGGEYMPQAPSVCPELNEVSKCYLNGDFRANELPGPSSIINLFLREHNRLARELKKINPDWNDEKLFQEGRRINIAAYQHITYYHYLPEILGRKRMYDYNLLYYPSGAKKVNDYNPKINADVAHEHAQAANRFFHNLPRGDYDLINKDEKWVGASLVRDSYLQPSYIQTGTFFDDLLRGLTRSPCIAPGKDMVDDLKEFLFRGFTKFAQDLKAADIQRGRDVGLVSYNDARHYCGLSRARRWSGFSGEISQEDIDKLRQVYAHPDDVELFVGGSLEKILKDATTGPTFNCIMLDQAYISRVGDRFWYETSDPIVEFTGEQLREIRKSSLARILCDNGQSIHRMQYNVFRLPSKRNPIVDCNKIPKMNLKYWKEESYEESDY